MTVNTKKAERRALRFDSHAQMLAEAERLAAAPRVRSTGNWNVAQALAHLTGAMRMSLDGTSLSAPWWLRLLGSFFKGRILRGPMPAGHQAPPEVHKEFMPDDSITVDRAIAEFREAVRRLETEPQRHPHPVFGALSRAEWDELHRRHAELHLAFHDVA